MQTGSELLSRRIENITRMEWVGTMRDRQRRMNAIFIGAVIFVGAAMAALAMAMTMGFIGPNQ
jgi:hypothetical protein